MSAAANNSHGATLKNFYTEFHVLDSDQFFIDVVPPDGTVAW